MKSEQRVFCWVVLIAQFAFSAHGQTGQAQNQVSAGSQDVQATEAPLPPEVPGAPPEIICKGDQLTIAARGSTLSSILRAVHNCTGAKIDIPENVPESRFFDTIGPGPMREVLASLLDATNFNYVIGSSESNPEKVETITLIARIDDPGSDSKTGDRTLSASRRAFAQMRRNYLTAGVPGGNESSSLAQDQNASQQAEPPSQPAPDIAATTAVTQSAARQTAPAPEPSDASQPAAEPAAKPQAEANPAPARQNSVEDQINSMQQLFQQRQQMIAQQPPQH